MGSSAGSRGGIGIFRIGGILSRSQGGLSLVRSGTPGADVRTPGDTILGFPRLFELEGRLLGHPTTTSHADLEWKAPESKQPDTYPKQRAHFRRNQVAYYAITHHSPPPPNRSLG
jgi:hypothetical protein